MDVQNGILRERIIWGLDCSRLGGVAFNEAGSHLSFLVILIGEENDKDPKRAV